MEKGISMRNLNHFYDSGPVCRQNSIPMENQGVTRSLGDDHRSE